ncbi:MAG: hypothetical protein KAJ91_02640 [Candidatus Aenigmarchaeota archaeon]|nr:hypothetical protein [Candidatus Aenigmarchaeota archaeon]
MNPLNIRYLTEEEPVAGRSASLLLSITAEGNSIEDVDVLVDVESTGRVEYDDDGNPVVVIDEVQPGVIKITVSKDGFEDGTIEIPVLEPEDEPPIPTPEPDLPVGADSAVIQFAEALRMGFTYRSLDRAALNQITSGLSALGQFIMGEADDAAKAQAQEVLDIVGPEISNLEAHVQKNESTEAEVAAARTDARKAQDEVSRLIPLFEETKDKATVAFDKSFSAEETANRIVGQTDEDIQRAADKAVKKAMGKKKLIFI